jgi:hypothetical protein
VCSRARSSIMARIGTAVHMGQQPLPLEMRRQPAPRRQPPA